MTVSLMIAGAYALMWVYTSRWLYGRWRCSRPVHETAAEYNVPWSPGALTLASMVLSLAWPVVWLTALAGFRPPPTAAGRALIHIAADPPTHTLCGEPLKNGERWRWQATESTEPACRVCERAAAAAKLKARITELERETGIGQMAADGGPMSTRTVYSCDLCGTDAEMKDISGIPAFLSREPVHVGRCCWQRPIADLIETFRKLDPAPKTTATCEKRKD